jgi:hypothetical protein
MGRRKKKLLTLTLEEESVELVDYYAGKLHRSRAEVLRALVNYGLDSKETMNAIGVFRIESLKKRGVIPQLPLGHYE